MSSGFSGDYFPFTGRSRRPYTPQLPELLPDPTAQILRSSLVPDFPGKRSLAEFQAQQQQNQALSQYLRSVRARTHNTDITPQISNFSALNYSNLSQNAPITPQIPNYSTLSYSNLSGRQEFNRHNARITPSFSPFNHPNLVPGVVIKQNTEITPSLTQFSPPNHVINDKLQELEKQLLDDDEDGAVSVITSSEWSDTLQHLIGPPQNSLSPTSSCSSTSCSSSPPSLIEAATAISENKPGAACEILTRLNKSACATGTAEHRLTSYFSHALRRRVGDVAHAPVVCELYGEDHAISTHMLYEASPCFKLGFMAANLAILDATSSDPLHVVDFDICRGGHYVHLIHALAAGAGSSPLKITAVTEFGKEAVNRLERVGEGLKAIATRAGVSLTFKALSLKVNELTSENLGLNPDEKLAVNLCFKLFRLPDESVSTENLRDELLRRVKQLSPAVVTVVEQEMNTNTAPFLTRVSEAREYYAALFESLDATVSRDSLDRVQIEKGLGRKLTNVVSCEGRERVERCEVFGKWRARMGMAGFKPRPITRPAVESLRAKLSSGSRGNAGFTVKDENGGVLFGWMGRTLTVASAWQ